MSSEELKEQIRELRAQGRTPKQIARVLGAPQRTVAAVVRDLAAQARATAPERAVAGCWVSPGWSAGLTVEGDHDWTDVEGDEVGSEGLVSVLVARQHRHGKVSVSGYLVDVYCMGVKNAVEPYILDDGLLDRHVREFFSAYPTLALSAPLELARHIVFGAVEYARELGFEPHPDYAETVGHLGDWTGPSDIRFGREGKPFYMAGPYDDAQRIVRTLERTVGPGNYDYMVAVPAEAGWL